MTRVLALGSAADPTGWGKQFDLARPLLGGRFEVTRVTLPADVRPLLSAADAVHTLGAAAFRAVRRLALESVWPGSPPFPVWVASGAAAVEPPLGFTPGLKAAISQSEHERDWAARLLPAPMQFSVRPAVERTLHPPGAVPTAAPGGCGVPTGRYVLAAGGFDAAANLKEAVWAFDVLKYAHPDLQLVLLGDGPLRTEVERFARTLGFDDLRVRCVGHVADVGPYLRQAEQVWGTHTRGGVKFLLEAMAAGVPVLATRTPDSGRVISDGVNGLLVPVGRPVELATAAHALLAAADRRRALVVAGQGAAGGYAVADLAEALAGAYHSLTSPSPPRPE